MIRKILNRQARLLRQNFDKPLSENLYHFNNNPEILRSILNNCDSTMQQPGVLWASHLHNFWRDHAKDIEEASLIFKIYSSLKSDSAHKDSLNIPYIEDLCDSVEIYKDIIIDILNLNILCLADKHSPFMINNPNYCGEDGFCLVFDSEKFRNSLHFLTGDKTKHTYSDGSIGITKVCYERDKQEEEILRLFNVFNTCIQKSGIEYKDVPSTFKKQFITLFILDGLFMKRPQDENGYRFSKEKETRVLIGSLAKGVDSANVPAQYPNKNLEDGPIQDLSKLRVGGVPCHTKVFFGLDSLKEIRCYSKKSQREIEQFLEERGLQIEVNYFDFAEFANSNDLVY